MITSFFLQILFYFVNFLVGFLPSGNLPSGFSDSLIYFWNLINSFSYILAVDTLLQGMLVVGAFELAILAFHFIEWLLKKIPFLHIR